MKYLFLLQLIDINYLHMNSITSTTYTKRVRGHQNQQQVILFQEVVISIQKYYYQMSLQSQYQEQQLKNLQQSQLVSNSRKKSDSTLQVTENVKQKMDQHNLNENKQQQEDFDEDIYNDLSSGVYQMSRKSQQDQLQQEDKQYFSLEIKMGEEVSQKQPLQNSALETKPKDKVVTQNYEEVDMNVEEYMQKVLSSKLQSQDAPSQNQQEQFAYPSLMEQSYDANKGHFSKQHLQQIQNQEIQNTQNSAQLKVQIKSLQNKIQKAEILQNKKIVQRENLFLAKTEDLLDIQNEEKLKASQIAKRQEQKIINQQSLGQKFKLDKQYQETKLKILGYQKQYFLKIETQVYQIQFSSIHKSYTFNRKFADFILLQKLIKVKYPGYILYPFPQNSLEFFNKIKLSVGTELEKAILIEKRLLQLQKYLNYLFTHKQLGNSEIFVTFISESDQHFTRHITYLQNLFEKQQQKFESSKLKQNYKSIKNLVMSGLSYFKSYVSSNQKNIQNTALLAELKRKCEALKVNYDEIIVDLQKNKLVTSNIQIKAQKIAEIYQCNIEMKPIESSIDSVLKLSSKMASSKTAYQTNKNWVQDKMLSKIYYFVHTFAQAQEQIQYRKSLLQKVDSLQQEQARLGLTIIQRIQIFDSRFIEDWNKLKSNFEQQYQSMLQQFCKQWQLHCGQMSKIWK